ncbi:hypothetical protein CC80DRAFT_511501 [Byssothecium circinans]|uniref:BTB domain-containing protein n=1 Tax=Byssothecium circinans TaxID=147558 RepID=A0A6A5T923_9PLEO|nr:hypothetical protein CC80DRAFT_511501 [Byssothecium circinans]
MSAQANHHLPGAFPTDTRPAKPSSTISVEQQKDQLANILQSKPIKQAIQNTVLEIALDPTTPLGAEILKRLKSAPGVETDEQVRAMLEAKRTKHAIRKLALDKASDPHNSLGQRLLQKARENASEKRATNPDTTTIGTDFISIFSEIDARLDTWPTNPNIIPAPPSKNPLLTSSSIILLETTPASASTFPSTAAPQREEPTCFAVHKSILSHNSSFVVAYFYNRSAKEAEKVFSLDADKDTLGHFVAWLYRPKEFDLKLLTADTLLGLLCICIDLKITALHNAIVSVLLNRHTHSDKKFDPSKATVIRVYGKKKSGDGARELCAYLLALLCTAVTDGEPGRQGVVLQEVLSDVQEWLSKGIRLGTWEEMPASHFFLRIKRETQ